jgi:hypothetical protein
MDDDNLRDQILRLEAQIDELTEVIESCRKLILVSKIAIAAGGIWLLAFTFGAIRFDPMAMIGAISAVIGGTVIFGSNTSTSKQATAAIAITSPWTPIFLRLPLYRRTSRVLRLEPIRRAARAVARVLAFGHMLSRRGGSETIRHHLPTIISLSTTNPEFLAFEHRGATH